MDFGMLDPLCVACQIPDNYRLVVSNRRMFRIEVEVKFEYLPEPPSVTSDCHDDALMPDISREETYEFWIDVDQLSQDAAGEQKVRDMLMEAGVMYTRHHEYMIETVLSEAVSIVSDEGNRDAEVLPMRVSIWCADPCIHQELIMSEDEELAMAYDEGEDMDTEEEEEEEEAIVMIGPWLKGLTEVEVTEGSIDRCTICCEDIVVGSTASSMPCRHVYHRECIARWLKNSRTCPLCRFELP